MNQLAFSYVDLVEDQLGISVKKKVDPARIEAYSTIGGAPHLDKEYTIFGRVVEGIEVVDKLAAVRVGKGDRPIEPTYLTMELVPMKKKEITDKYGYEYPVK